MAARSNLLGFGQVFPRVEEGAYVNSAAILVGDVTVMKNASVWPGAVLKGDAEKVIIESGAVILDRAIIRACRGHPATVGAGALVSHDAVVAGCSIGPGTLVGTKACVLEGARIANHCVIDADAVVAAGTLAEPYSMLSGAPAKLERRVSLQEAQEISMRVVELGKMAMDYGDPVSFRWGSLS